MLAKPPEFVSGKIQVNAEVLEDIYQEAHDIGEGETAYRKDRDGMYITKWMKREEIAAEVGKVVGKIAELVGVSVE
ncbi:hypothetical protein [Halorientalis salina]|uniref:hypothetical protein n=1 Tax=Halorientalis salina TaxID=2932266 RepID=UPI0010ABEACE|nr:hypothetical protein [Halorientalis salina]